MKEQNNYNTSKIIKLDVTEVIVHKYNKIPIIMDKKIKEHRI